MKHEGIARATSYLRCPVCSSPLVMAEGGGSLICTADTGKRHCFDLARSGYVNLDLGHNAGGDGKELVSSRTAFLESGAYSPISDAVNSFLKEYADDGFVIDAGCGEGYYTNRAALALPRSAFLGIDLSKWAVDRGAKSATQKGSLAGFAVGGIFSLPVRNECASAVMNLFAPCAETEFSRVLSENGILVLVGAGEDHLLGLKRAVYDVPYKNTPRADLPQNMRLVAEKRLTYTAHLDSAETIRNLFSMTPYAFRTSREDMEKLNRLDHLDTEVDVMIYVYQKKL